MKRSFFAFALIGLALLAGLVFTVQSSSSTTQINAQAVAAANQLVNAGHYTEAAQMYEQLARRTRRTPHCSTTWATRYFLQGDASRALAAYEQAAALAPRDADIRANLALAQQALGQAGSPSTGPAGARRRRQPLVDRRRAGAAGLGRLVRARFAVLVWRARQPKRRPALSRISTIPGDGVRAAWPVLDR